MTSVGVKRKGASKKEGKNLQEKLGRKGREGEVKKRGKYMAEVDKVSELRGIVEGQAVLGVSPEGHSSDDTGGSNFDEVVLELLGREASVLGLTAEEGGEAGNVGGSH